MMELRHNPIIDEWILIASDRQKRPVQPTSNACPLCPGGAEFDRDYDLAVFDNRFPSLKMDAPMVKSTDDVIFQNRPSFGKCEVIMYTSDHSSAMSRMPIGQIEKLVYVWEDRTRDLMRFEDVKYIYPFENRGKEVGATLSHPHGQLYAFPFVPKRIRAMVNAQKDYRQKWKSCVICDLVKAELKSKKHVIYENDHFIAVVPYFARFPYEVHIYPKRHFSFFMDMTTREKFDLAVVLKVVASKYDALFREEFPYMMAIFQSPVNPSMDDFHFHIEFYPPKRDKNKIKWMASVETGTWTFINPTTPSEIAAQLRNTPYTI